MRIDIYFSSQRREFKYLIELTGQFNSIIILFQRSSIEELAPLRIRLQSALAEVPLLKVASCRFCSFHFFLCGCSCYCVLSHSFSFFMCRSECPWLDRAVPRQFVLILCCCSFLYIGGFLLVYCMNFLLFLYSFVTYFKRSALNTYHTAPC